MRTISYWKENDKYICEFNGGQFEFNSFSAMAKFARDHKRKLQSTGDITVTVLDPRPFAKTIEHQIIEIETQETEPFNLRSIDGIGDKKMERFEDAGLNDPLKLAETPAEMIADIAYVSLTKAFEIKLYAEKFTQKKE